MDVLGEQWAPAHGWSGALDRRGEHVGHACAEVARQLGEKFREVLLRARRHDVAPILSVRLPNMDSKAFVLFGGLHLEAG